MPVPRRDFMKLFGASLGSLLLARCQRKPASGTPDYVTCYEIVLTVEKRTPVTTYPEPVGPRDRLRLLWLRFGELAEKTAEGANGGEGEDNPLGREMIADHRSALLELVDSARITMPVADLIQEAYSAAVYHVWRSNAMVTCYDMVYPDYAPDSAENLILQADVMKQLASGGTIAPGTLAKVRTALEHDLAFYALTDADVQALYDALRAEYGDPEETMPSFEEVELTLTPDAKDAAEFLIDLLSRP
ncbi:MAG: hypothetical protein ACK2UB_13375 [Anaerolineales bacterium]